MTDIVMDRNHADELITDYVNSLNLGVDIRHIDPKISGDRLVTISVVMENGLKINVDLATLMRIVADTYLRHLVECEINSVTPVLDKTFVNGYCGATKLIFDGFTVNVTRKQDVVG